MASSAQCVGGNSGIGVQTARALSHAGAKVIITSRNDEAGQEVAGQLNTAGLKVTRMAPGVLWLAQSLVRLLLACNGRDQRRISPVLGHNL